MTRAHRKTAWLAAVIALGTGLAATTAGSPAHAVTTGQSRGQISPPQGIHPGAQNAFSAVSADSATDAWAVGYYTGTDLNAGIPLIAHWNGTAWSQTAAPAVAGSAQLTGVTAVSPSNAWAVGSYFPTATPTVQDTLIMHWNGTAWSQVASPSPSSTGNALSGVSADSATDVWAVGDYSPDGHAVDQDTLALHWDGTAWTQVRTPSPPTTTTSSVSIDWLSGVSASSPISATAVGYYLSGAEQNVTKALVLTWNGTAWTHTTSPQPSAKTNELSGVSGTATARTWAAGDYSNSSGAQDTLVVGRKGTSWAKFSSPSPGAGPNQLNAVSSDTDSNAWAVGYQRANAGKAARQTLAVRWNGTSWTHVTTPDPGGASPAGNDLTGVSAVSATNAWAVGFCHKADGPNETIILHWNGTAWSSY